MPKPRTDPKACTTSRIAAGYTIRGAADHLPCTFQHLAQIEAGKCGAGPAVLKAMAELYGVPIETLYTLNHEDAA